MRPGTVPARASALIAMLLIAICSCAPGPPRQTEDPPPLPFARDLQEALDAALRETRGAHDLGISAAVIVPGYRPWAGASGDSGPGARIAPDMLFEAGSVAKSFEAALALELAEEGSLDLDDPVSRWLPPYRNVDPAITVRQLLNHTSGIFNVFEHPDFPWARPGIDHARRWKPEEVFEAFVLEAYGPPGYAQHYSSTNYLLLTAILEKAAGAPVPAEVERRFLGPLNLRHTFMGMGEPLPDRFSAARAWVDADRDGRLEEFTAVPRTWIASLTHPVLFTTAGDLARWMDALYRDRIVLPPDALDQMLTFPGTQVGDPEGLRYGLGVVDFSGSLGTRVIGHAGSSMGYSAAALYLPDLGASLAWMVNTGEAPPELAGGIMGRTWSSLSDVLKVRLRATDDPAPAIGE